jgi:biopolymer transport protein ExbB/TolQ
MLIQYLKEEWVMWPIAALSIASFAITVERITVLILEKVQMSPTKVLNMFTELLRKNNGYKPQTVEAFGPVIENKSGVCAALMRTVMHKYRDGAAKNMDSATLKQWMRMAAEEQAVLETPALESHLVWLAVISNVATLMGLFGTVYGMIGAFTAMSQAVGGVKADEMAGGIAVALIATLFGLFVAIPALLLYNWVKNMVEAHIRDIDNTVTSTIDLLAE